MWQQNERQVPAMNHNVKLGLWWSLLENCSASVRSGDVMSALLFLLTGSNTTVGVIQGVNGVVQMVVALPSGWLADKYRRDTMLRYGAAVGAVAGAVLAYALAFRPTALMLGAAMSLLGCYRGIYSAALEAIWADSIQSGRSSLYTKRYSLTVVASSFGPWLSLTLFHFLGNQWHTQDCRLVLGSGIALMLFPLAIMCCFDDDRALAEGGHQAHQAQQQPQQQPPQQQQRHGEQQQQQQQEQGREDYAALPSDEAGCQSGSEARDGSRAEEGRMGNGAAAAAAAEAGSSTPAAACVMDGPTLAARGAGPEAGGGGSSCSVPDVAALAQPGPANGVALAGATSVLTGPSELDWVTDGGPTDIPTQAPGCCGRLPVGLVVTLLISFSDFIGALASGMTLRFFALFFMQEVGFRPMAVSLIGALSPLGIAAASLACQPLSKLVGRVQISLFTRSLDILLLVCLAYLPTQPASAHGLLVAVHLTRMAVANATRPLVRSVLMDCVPRQHRGKVNAIDSIRTFSWSGSAAAGGWLIEKYGFQTTFLVTACIKLVAFLPLFPLLAYVPDGIRVPAGVRGERLRRQQQWVTQGMQHVQPAVLQAPPAVAVQCSGGGGHSGAGKAGGLRQPLLGGGASS